MYFDRKKMWYFPDPYQNETDPDHWVFFKIIFFIYINLATLFRL